MIQNLIRLIKKFNIPIIKFQYIITNFKNKVFQKEIKVYKVCFFNKVHVLESETIKQGMV